MCLFYEEILKVRQTYSYGSSLWVRSRHRDDSRCRCFMRAPLHKDIETRHSASLTRLIRASWKGAVTQRVRTPPGIPSPVSPRRQSQSEMPRGPWRMINRKAPACSSLSARRSTRPVCMWSDWAAPLRLVGKLGLTPRSRSGTRSQPRRRRWETSASGQAILVAAGDREHAEAQHRRQRVHRPLRIPPLLSRCRRAA